MNRQLQLSPFISEDMFSDFPSSKSTVFTDVQESDSSWEKQANLIELKQDCFFEGAQWDRWKTKSRQIFHYKMFKNSALGLYKKILRPAFILILHVCINKIIIFNSCSTNWYIIIKVFSYLNDDAKVTSWNLEIQQAWEKVVSDFSHSMQGLHACKLL